MSLIQIYDDFLFYVERVQNKALGATYGTHHGFPGIAPLDEQDWFANGLRGALPLPIKVNSSFFRKSPLNQEEPNYIHTDADMGQYTALLYLNHNPPEGDGTTFWKRKETESCTGQWTSEMGKDARQWERVKDVAMRFNRCVIFDSRLYHSRTLKENFGEGDSARLVQTIFFSL